MKKLEDYGVQELNTKEMKKINGGDVIIVTAAHVFAWTWSLLGDAMDAVSDHLDATGTYNPAPNGCLSS